MIYAVYPATKTNKRSDVHIYLLFCFGEFENFLDFTLLNAHLELKYPDIFAVYLQKTTYTPSRLPVCFYVLLLQLNIYWETR
jgi:hypothetical protein